MVSNSIFSPNNLLRCILEPDISLKQWPTINKHYGLQYWKQIPGSSILQFPLSVQHQIAIAILLSIAMSNRLESGDNDHFYSLSFINRRLHLYKEPISICNHLPFSTWLNVVHLSGRATITHRPSQRCVDAIVHVSSVCNSKQHFTSFLTKRWQQTKDYSRHQCINIFSPWNQSFSTHSLRFRRPLSIGLRLQMSSIMCALCMHDKHIVILFDSTWGGCSVAMASAMLPHTLHLIPATSLVPQGAPIARLAINSQSVPGADVPPIDDVNRSGRQ